MSLCLLNNVKKSNIFIKPFPHVVIENALDWNIYNELVCSLNLLDIKNQMEPLDGYEIRYKYSKFKNQICLPNIWDEFLQYHSSTEFVNKVINIFGNKIKEIDKKFYKKFKTEDVFLRDHEPAWINKHSLPYSHSSDSQIVIHNPLNDTETTRTPHIDSPKELYAGLLYMKQDEDISTGGDLELYSAYAPGDFLKKDGKLREACLDKIEKEKVIKYKKNNFIIFLNTKDAIHGVSPRIKSKLNRLSVNVILEKTNGKYKI